MDPTNIANAADYADAMLTARRTKNWLVVILFSLLVSQFFTFYTLRYTGLMGDQSTDKAALLFDGLHALTNLVCFGASVCVIALTFILVMTTNIMLVGRLLGVAHLTSAFAWCLVLGLLIFPWQAVFYSPTVNAYAFEIPGVVYTWPELLADARFNIAKPLGTQMLMLKWARFIGFPVASLVLLAIVQWKSARGFRSALGESELED